MSKLNVTLEGDLITNVDPSDISVNVMINGKKADADVSINKKIVENVTENPVVEEDDTEVYEFTINQNDTNPWSIIRYTGKNKYYIPARMNYATDKFEYGSWKDAFFIKNLKPCVLGVDGSLLYVLNPDNYNYKKNGLVADVSSQMAQKYKDDLSYFVTGNVMVGIPKTYIKSEIIGDGVEKVYISNKKLDDDYHCYAHIDYSGEERDYAYLAAYNGSLDEYFSLRSLSGKNPIKRMDTNAEILAAKNNGSGWYIETFSMRCLLIYLLMLISRSTDLTTAFGRGSVHPTESHIITTGTMDEKGLFWGSNDGTSGVKVFGIENLWGSIWNRVAGIVNDNGFCKVKLCWGTSDGSDINEYNPMGNGYMLISDDLPDNGIVESMIFWKGIMVPKSTNTGIGQSFNRNYCEPFTNSNDDIYCACYGGSWGLSGYGPGSLNLTFKPFSQYVQVGVRPLFI